VIRRAISAANFISHKLNADMIELITSDLQLSTNNLKQALVLFKQSLKMEVELIDDDTAIVNLGAETQLQLRQEINGEQTDQVHLITPDCIAVYCLLKSKGVVFKQLPNYSDNGMNAKFFDAYGNLFLLLEPRNYNNS
jgi:hypothetical protein